MALNLAPSTSKSAMMGPSQTLSGQLSAARPMRAPARMKPAGMAPGNFGGFGIGYHGGMGDTSPVSFGYNTQGKNFSMGGSPSNNGPTRIQGDPLTSAPPMSMGGNGMVADNAPSPMNMEGSIPTPMMGSSPMSQMRDRGVVGPRMGGGGSVMDAYGDNGMSQIARTPGGMNPRYRY